MATVYLARDVRHARRVALKVLKPELGAVLGIDRFLAEIQVTANLQHPNLLPLFDSGEANGLLFYVMPFVEGESLRARLEREKQLPVDEAVRIAVAIAGALDYAHQQGVIHRDLKPENVLLQAGQPVIADFGIALAVSNAGGTRVTQTGLSLGTPQYMSPEQATGDRGIDGRTDIYSLSAITYEMLTGEAPHLGTSAQAIIAKLMTEEVRPVTTLRRSVPMHVDAAVRHGLEKLPADRFATAGDFARALTGERPWVDSGARQTGAASAERAVPRMDRRVMVAMVGLSVVTVAAVGTAIWLGTRPEPQPVAARFEIRLPDSVRLFAGGGTKLAITSDGRAIAIVGERQASKGIYLRRIDDPVARLVRGTEGTGRFNVSPRFSPDGQWIAFVTEDRSLVKVPVGGGTATVLADSTGGNFEWGDGDRLLYTRRNSLWSARGDGRDKKLLAPPDTARGQYRYLWPDILPGGERALIAIDRARGGLLVDSLQLGIVSLSDGRITDLGVAGTNPYYVSSGHVLFGRPGGLLYAAPFSLRKGAFTGTPQLIHDGLAQGTGGATGFAVADNGTLLYHEADSEGTGRLLDLVVVGRDGRERVVPGDRFDASLPRVSADGRRVALISADRARPTDDVMVIDLESGARQRLANDAVPAGVVWDRTGKRVMFVREADRRDEIVSRAWDRSSADVVTRLQDTVTRLGAIAMGPSGGYSALTVNKPGGNRDIYLAPTDSLFALRSLLATSSIESRPDVSPDGRFITYTSDESGIPEIYVQPIPGPGPRLQVSINGGTESVWGARDEVLYRANGFVISARLQGARVTGRDTLFPDNYAVSANSRSWDVISGGRAFLFLRRPQGQRDQEVMALLNWHMLPSLRNGDSKR